jgi:hypothetical protein
MQLMSDKTKFIAFLELHKTKAEKIRQGIVKARSLMAEQGEATASIHGELGTDCRCRWADRGDSCRARQKRGRRRCAKSLTRRGPADEPRTGDALPQPR